jgi:hypothetical protein
MSSDAKFKFALGQIVATANVVRDIPYKEFRDALIRHGLGDWGDVCPEDRQLNEDALKNGDRLFSVYHSKERKKFWIITESDRSATTILLPEDY